ncbi:Cucumisin [Morella rubra]|uniref:Cucumisin n=1 Tax=Morella rubra TaxID=262757 RepID=A0A6A1VW44_9ROSI|nr:Cucumisin [Morella rubra]
MPTSIAVTVEPSVLSFSAIGEKKSFKVHVYGPNIAQQPITSGEIMWDDGVHFVRSPLVVFTVLPGSPYPAFSTRQKKPFSRDSSMHHKNWILGH